MTVMTMIMMIFMTIFMMTLPVGYTTADVVYQWTAGRGVNIASDMKLSQVWSSWSPPSSSPFWSKSLITAFFIIFLIKIKWPYLCYSQFDLISSPTGNETTHLNHGLPFSLKMMMRTMTRMMDWWRLWLWSEGGDDGDVIFLNSQDRTRPCWFKFAYNLDLIEI